MVVITKSVDDDDKAADTAFGREGGEGTGSGTIFLMLASMASAILFPLLDGPPLRLVRVFDVTFPGSNHFNGFFSLYPGQSIPAAWHFLHPGRPKSQTMRRLKHDQHCRLLFAVMSTIILFKTVASLLD